MKGSKKQVCCGHILNKERDILLVVRTEDYFQFLCGDAHDDEPELITLKEILAYDPSIQYVLELKKNHLIERESVDGLWILKYDKDEED
jgi:hypothetical protein